MKDNFQSSSLLRIKTFESGFEPILNFLNFVKNKIVSLSSYDFEEIVENINEDETNFEKYQNSISSNFDLLISTARVFESESENIPKNSYFFIRLKDMFSYVFYEKELNIKEVDILLETLDLIKKLLIKMEEILTSNQLNDKEKNNQINKDFESFFNEFSKMEMDFYSIIDSDENI